MSSLPTAARAPATDVPGRARSPVVRGMIARLPGAVLLCGFVVAWHFAVVLSDISSMLFPGPLEVWRELGEISRNGLLVKASRETVVPLLTGLVIGVGAGLLLGLLIGTSRRADMVTQPYMWGMFTTPDIAFVPIVIAWFGFGTTTKVLMVTLAVMIPMAIAVRDGVRTLDDSMVRVAVAFCASGRDLLRKVVLPATIPSVANGVRNGISKGFTGVLVVEMTVGSSGLGRQVIYTMIQFDMARMFAFVAVLVVIAVVLIALSKRLEAYASRWREEVAL